MMIPENEEIKRQLNIHANHTRKLREVTSSLANRVVVLEDETVNVRNQTNYLENSSQKLEFTTKHNEDLCNYVLAGKIY